VKFSRVVRHVCVVHSKTDARDQCSRRSPVLAPHCSQCVTPRSTPQMSARSVRCSAHFRQCSAGIHFELATRPEVEQ
jgi:hypothetical protein